MDLPCEQNSPQPPRLWRNGMDYEPKKTYPPDYSTVPDVRSWNMSPFSQERFDLDEIQRAEKKGCKGYAEMERLKKLYLSPKEEEKPSEEKKETVEKYQQPKCYTYQPYGPPLVPTISFSKPESNKNSLHKSFDPPFLKEVFHTIHAPNPCQKFVVSPPLNKFQNIYIPYGPLAEIRMSVQQYEPMGPTLRPYQPM